MRESWNQDSKNTTTSLSYNRESMVGLTTLDDLKTSDSTFEVNPTPPPHPLSASFDVSAFVSVIPGVSGGV